jgi:hypothetical protein
MPSSIFASQGLRSALLKMSRADRNPWLAKMAQLAGHLSGDGCAILGMPHQGICKKKKNETNTVNCDES